MAFRVQVNCLLNYTSDATQRPEYLTMHSAFCIAQAPIIPPPRYTQNIYSTEISGQIDFYLGDESSTATAIAICAVET